MMNNETILIWLFPVVFVILSLEEITMNGKYSHKLNARFTGKLQVLQMSMDPSQGPVTLLFKVAILTSFTFLAAVEHIYFFFLAVNTLFLFYLFLHLLRSLYVGGYTPGVVTAAFIALPYSFSLFSDLTSGQLVTWKQVFSSIPAGFILLPVILIGHLFENHPDAKTQGH
jgi:hypothetical protein